MEEEILCSDEPINAFKQYVQKIKIPYSDDGLKKLKYVTANGTSLMKIVFSIGDEDVKTQFDCIKETLAKFENIELSRYPTNNLYDKLLKYCLNLKILTIRSIFFNTEDRAWLHQKYARLEHISIQWLPRRIQDFQIFLQQNRNIRSFPCNQLFLAKNED